MVRLRKRRLRGKKVRFGEPDESLTALVVWSRWRN